MSCCDEFKIGDLIQLKEDGYFFSHTPTEDDEFDEIKVTKNTLLMFLGQIKYHNANSKKRDYKYLCGYVEYKYFSFEKKRTVTDFDIDQNIFELISSLP